jgi:hypothetical protein
LRILIYAKLDKPISIFSFLLLLFIKKKKKKRKKKGKKKEEEEGRIAAIQYSNCMQGIINFRIENNNNNKKLNVSTRDPLGRPDPNIKVS